MPSTLERPPEHFLKAFHLSQAGSDTIQTYLERGFSLAICCRSCPRMAEWTPVELEQRYGDRIQMRIRDLAERLKCTGEGGCGSDDVAVFPHLYDGEWPPRRR